MPWEGRGRKTASAVTLPSRSTLSPAEGDTTLPPFRAATLGKAFLQCAEPTPLGPLAPSARLQAGGGAIPAQTAGRSRAQRRAGAGAQGCSTELPSITRL